MIDNKNDLIEYLNEDKRIMNTNRKRPSLHWVMEMEQMPRMKSLDKAIR